MKRSVGQTSWPLRVACLMVASAGGWLWWLMGAPFHEDEAIYAAWALRVLRGDPWLWQTTIDKPPLTLYPVAASLALFGRHDWAARLPNLLWTLGLLALLRRLAARQGSIGWLAVGFALLSPLLWSHAAAAFTDPPMVALALLSLERARAGRPAQAGVAFALAFLAKPTAIFLLPLALVGASHQSPSDARRPWQETTSSFVQAAAAPLLLVWAWDASRTVPSWWVLGKQAYGTLGGAVGALTDWAAVAWTSLGWLTLVGALGALVARPGSGARDAWTVTLRLTALLWLPVHALLGFQPWARYLLPLVPLSALAWSDFLPPRALGLPPMRHGEPLRLPPGAVRVRPLAPGGPALPGPTRRGVRYPPPRLLLTGGLALLFVLLIPGFIEPYGVEPHDGRWEGIREIGAAIEALPADATVYNRAMSRPLAWYAADSRAALVWLGDCATQRAALTGLAGGASSEGSYFLAWRTSEPLPCGARGWRTVRESGDFRLLVPK